MRKITLLFFVFTFFITQAQNTTTGTIELAGSDFTVRFDVDGPNDTVTMTMVGPSNVWLGVALDADYAEGQGMGIYSNKDLILYTSNGLVDASLNGTTSPDTTEAQNWTVISNDAPGSIRTIVATRQLDTGDSADYVFTTNTGSFNLLWAKHASSLDLGYHSGGRGGKVAAFTLSSPYFTMEKFEIYPNPTINELNFEFPQNIQSANVQVYNLLGKQILQKTLKKKYPKLNTSSWASGMYVVQIITENAVQTKRVVKQ